MSTSPYKGKESTKFIARNEEVKAVVERMDEEEIWDSVQARDLDPKIIDFVSEALDAGHSAREVCRMMGIKGGVASRQWKKIQANFRQGFRADAEAYLFQQTRKFYKVIEQAKEVLEDAFENGTPHVVSDGVGPTEIIYVKGATKELGAFLKNYSDAIALPVRLWKDFGAIGEKKEAVNGVTIQVMNNIQFPSADEIRRHQEEIAAKAKAIEVEKVVDVES